MASVERMIRRATLFVCSMLAAGCDSPKHPASAKGPPGTVAFAPGPAASGTKSWDDDIGAVVATPAIDGVAPLFFSRDTAGSADLDVELFNHDDRVLPGKLHPVDAERACGFRRHALVTSSGANPAPNNWSLALSPGIAAPFGIDGIGELLPRDSAKLVARISRLVSAIPEDSASAQFRGLPVVVRDAWRFKLADSTAIVVAVAMRSLNVESNPRAQFFTMIAEPDSSAGADALRNAFSESQSGPEDRVEGADLLAAFRLKGTRPAVALALAGSSGLQVEIVERTSPGVWKIRWSSASLPCAQP